MPNIKLTEAQVTEILDAWFNTNPRPTQHVLSDKYRVTIQTIWKITSRLCWLHVPVPGPQAGGLHQERMDDRRANLRPCRAREGQIKRHLQAGGTSLFPGVSWGKAKRKWRAQIMLDGKVKNLGNFTDEHEAAAAYQAALPK